MKNTLIKRRKRLLIYILNIVLLFIVSALLDGVIISPIFNNFNYKKEKNSQIVSFQNQLFELANETRLLSYDENDNQIKDLNSLINDEIKKEVKTYLISISYEFKGELIEEVKEYDNYHDSRLNYYLFTYRSDILKVNLNENKEFIQSNYNNLLKEYYDLNFDDNLLSLNRNSAINLYKYLFEEDYSTFYSTFYHEFMNNYLSFFNLLIDDFESNNIDYKENLVLLDDAINIYSFYELIEILLAYLISYFIIYILPLVIFKKDKDFIMKLFKAEGKDINNNSLKINKLRFKNIIYLFLNLYIIFFNIFFFYYSLNILNISILFITPLIIIIFMFLLSIFNGIYALFNKNKMSLVSRLINEILVNIEEFLIEDGKE